MNDKTQTAVEWLFNQMSNVAAGYVTEMDSKEMLTHAKQMEKEQIVDAIFFGMQKGLNVNKVPETDNDWVNNYYNETYGGQDDN